MLEQFLKKTCPESLLVDLAHQLPFISFTSIEYLKNLRIHYFVSLEALNMSKSLIIKGITN